MNYVGKVILNIKAYKPPRESIFAPDISFVVPLGSVQASQGLSYNTYLEIVLKRLRMDCSQLIVRRG